MRLLTSAVFDCLLLFVGLVLFTQVVMPGLRGERNFPVARTIRSWVSKLSNRKKP